MCRILHFNNSVQDICAYTSLHGCDLTAEPLQQIQRVDRLIDQHPTAL